MTHADKENMKTAVGRIIKQFENTTICVGDKNIRATASFGIVGFHGTMPPDWNTLLTRADTALYAAKRNGRNRMEFEPDGLHSLSDLESAATR
jgi:GGDEF domain-containing protein